MRRDFTIAAEQMLPASETRLQRLWRRLRRRPAPTIQPSGTVPMIIELTNGDGSYSRIYLPAGRIS